MDTNLPACTPLLIGSLPLTDPQEAAELVVKNLPEAPGLPELPRRSWREDMINSRTGGLPCLQEDAAAGSVWIDAGGEHCPRQLAAFWEKVMQAESDGDVSAFAVDGLHASALEPFARELAKLPHPSPYVKVQCAGPVSFQLGLKDKEGRALYFDDTFQQVLARQIEMQSRWLARRLAAFGRRVLVFLDEPGLAAFGSSAMLGVSREQVIARLRPVVAALKTESVLVGVHVCGNTDWSMILDCEADIVSYDAYGYGESLNIYADRVQRFLGEGGMLAWGIVPNDQHLAHESTNSLRERLLRLVDELAGRGACDRRQILARSFITPSCGLASLAPDQVIEAIGLCRELSLHLRRQVMFS